MKLNSKIDSVLVYREKALIERVAHVEGEVPNQVAIGHLPLCLEDGSVQTRVETAAGKVLALSHRVELEFEAAEVQQVDEQRLQELSEQERILGARLRALRAELEQVDRICMPVWPNPNVKEAKFSLKARRELVSLQQERRQTLEARACELEEQLTAVHVESAEIRHSAKLAQAEARQEQRLHRKVTVSLECDRPDQVEQLKVFVSYQVPGVRWAPSYSFRFDRDLTMVEMLMRASVCQNTGEDWKGVKLSVSTSDPCSWKELPELASQRIGRLQPVLPKRGWRPPPLDTETLFADYDRGPVANAHGGMPTRPQPPAAKAGWYPNGASAPPDAPPAPCSAPVACSAPAGDFFLGAACEFDDSGDDLFGGVSATLFDEAEPEPPPARPKKALLQARASLQNKRPGMRRGMVRKEELHKPALARRSAPAEPQQQFLECLSRGGSYDFDWGDSLFAPRLEVGKELLEYGLLRMPAPHQAGRGRLQRQTALEACLHLWKSQGLELPFDVAWVVSQALHRAQVNAPPPSGHHLPQAVEGFDYQYRGEVPVDVPADGRYHSLPLLTRSLTARQLLICVPRESSEVFRQAEVDSLPDLALPAGPVDVMVGKSYLLTTQLENVLPGSSLHLGLGVDQNLKVARNTSYRETTSGMMNNRLHLHHSIAVELANRSGRDLNIEVRERIPVVDKNEKDVQLEMHKCDWQPIPDAPDGHYRCSLRLPGRESATLEANYTITMPAKLELVGGNRREQ